MLIDHGAFKLFRNNQIRLGNCTVAPMTEHKFKIGERLFVARQLPDETYVVVKRLPKRAGEFEYEIKRIDDEPDERVVRESQLRLSYVR